MSDNTNINKYTVTGKIFKGVEIDSLLIENKDHLSKSVSMEDMVKLARSNKLSNATYALDSEDGKYIIDVNNGLSNLQEIKSNHLDIQLLGRLISKENKCVGYKAQDSNGKTYKLSINKVWDLALQGSVRDVKAEIYNNHKVLVSENNLLSTIPIFRN